jgi:hypothetical protein
MARASCRRSAAAATACALLLALALAAWAPARADAAVDVASCTLEDCCWRGEASRERFCACRGRIRSGGSEPAGCGQVGCGLTPPADACDIRKPPPGAQTPPKPPAGGGPSGSKSCVCKGDFAPVCADGTTYASKCLVRTPARVVGPAFPRLIDADDGIRGVCVLPAAHWQARCDGRFTFTPGACKPPPTKPPPAGGQPGVPGAPGAPAGQPGVPGQPGQQEGPKEIDGLAGEAKSRGVGRIGAGRIGAGRIGAMP